MLVFPHETWDPQQESAGTWALPGSKKNMDKGDAQSISITEELPAKHKSLLDSAAALRQVLTGVCVRQKGESKHLDS